MSTAKGSGVLGLSFLSELGSEWKAIVNLWGAVALLTKGICFSFVSGQVLLRAPPQSSGSRQKSLLRTRSTTTRDRNLQFRGAVSTGFFWVFSSRFFPFSPGLLCNWVRKPPQKCGENCPIFWRRKSVESCHFSGCHIFSVPTYKQAHLGLGLSEQTGRKPWRRSAVLRHLRADLKRRAGCNGWRFDQSGTCAGRP